MSIFFDENPEDGTVRFHHEAILGARKVPAEQTGAEMRAGKRPRMVPNPLCRIPADAQPIDDKLFDDLMKAQRAGKTIAIQGGKPVAIEPEQDPEERRAVRRRKRDLLLAASDWTQLPDSPLPDTERVAWQNYRQELRELDMDAADWPTSPSNDQETE